MSALRRRKLSKKKSRPCFESEPDPLRASFGRALRYAPRSANEKPSLVERGVGQFSTTISESIGKRYNQTTKAAEDLPSYSEESLKADAVRAASERPRWERHSSVAEAVRAQPTVQCVLQVFGVSNCSRRSA